MNKPARQAAVGGIFAALCLICLYIAAYIPTNRLFFYALSSLFVSFVVVESGIGAGWLFYAATSLLAFLLIPDKLSVIPYATCLGLYGIIKYYIERVRSLILELILKGMFFAAEAAGLYYLYTKILLLGIETKIHIAGILAAALVIFFIYDYVYSRLITFYLQKLRTKLYGSR